MYLFVPVGITIHTNITFLTWGSTIKKQLQPLPAISAKKLLRWRADKLQSNQPQLI